jgi:hypothetical protein
MFTFPSKEYVWGKGNKKESDVHMPNFRIWFECGQNMAHLMFRASGHLSIILNKKERRGDLKRKKLH